ncbi:MAG: TRAP transporter large permease [Deltaproteobacteria bacterium]|nr:TRAP transporter large permease [Deltaproteobacteria bacterium]
MVEPGTATFISIFVVLFLMWIGLPIYVSLGITGILGIMALKGPYMALTVLKVSPYVSTANYLLAVIPLFIIMGHFAFKAGISNDLFSIGRKWFSKLPGGLAIATFIASAGFGACCGSSVASAATMGAIAIPEMRALGYDRKLACGIVAASGTLAIMIPPSVVSVFYASINDVSAGAQLVSGILPGILSVIIYVIGLLFLTRIHPSLCPAPETYTWRERFASLKGVWGMAVLFFLVIGGMYIGWFTPTEAASVGAFVALLMVVLVGRVAKGKLGENIRSCFLDTLRTTCMVFMILIGAGLYAKFLTLAQVPQVVSMWVGGLPLSPWMIVALFLVVYIPLGMFMDTFSMLIITQPIMFPIVTAQLGFDPIWFGVLCVKMAEVGLMTPPVGLNVYVLAGVVRDVPMNEIFRGCFWFLLFEAVSIVVLFMFPVISTYIPMTMYGR